MGVPGGGQGLVQKCQRPALQGGPYRGKTILAGIKTNAAWRCGSHTNKQPFWVDIYSDKANSKPGRGNS